jgi:hypothetical protein
MGTTTLAQVLDRLQAWGEQSEWVGADPYEGLNTPLGKIVPTRRGRQMVTQLYKRLPVEPRWPLRAPAAPNPKALALALSGYAALGAEKPRSPLLKSLADRLEQLAIEHSGGSAWGYPFRVQTRNIGYGRNSPNAISTCFVVGGLLDAYESTGERRMLDRAVSARRFLVGLRSESAHGPFFAYVPAGSDLIHNANLLVCGTLARLHSHEPDEAVGEAVRESVETATRRQRPDGLWVYGEAQNFDWIDNFHTAYALEGLGRAALAFGVGGENFAKGCEAWLRTFIEPDGWARYFHDRRFPLETHSCATAIDLLSQPLLEGVIPDRTGVGERIARCAVGELWMPDVGRFAFKVTAHRRIEREFMRWTNAPMFRALARLLGERS